jgi:hypothetical protein
VDGAIIYPFWGRAKKGGSRVPGAIADYNYVAMNHPECQVGLVVSDQSSGKGRIQGEEVA